MRAVPARVAPGELKAASVGGALDADLVVGVEGGERVEHLEVDGVGLQRALVVWNALKERYAARRKESGGCGTMACFPPGAASL